MTKVKSVGSNPTLCPKKTNMSRQKNIKLILFSIDGKRINDKIYYKIEHAVKDIKEHLSIIHNFKLQKIKPVVTENKIALEGYYKTDLNKNSKIIYMNIEKLTLITDESIKICRYGYVR